MAFFIFFCLLILLILFIGFFPQLKSFFLTGNLRKKLLTIFLWLISTVLGFIALFQLRRAYQVLDHFEDFWQAMMFVENFLTGILLVTGFVFSFLLYGHYRENIWTRFLFITAGQILVYGFFNLLRLFLIYRIHGMLAVGELLFLGVLVTGAILIYRKVRQRTDYRLRHFYKDFFE